MRHLVLLLLIATLIGCAGPAGAPEQAAGPERPEVSMRLQWFPQFQFAGYIIAKVKGYYDEAGLDVTLNPGGPDLVPLPLVAAGGDEFGSTGADTVLIAREQGIPVVALATWFQTSPVAFMVHRDSGITSPQQFPGHTIGMFYGDNVETEYRALLAATGVDRERVRELPGDYSIVPFLERRVDIWPVYATDQPNTARREGAEIELIFARDYGVRLMGDVLFTTEAFARENPRTVQAFVEATLRGWEEALRDPEAAVELLLEYNPELDREQLRFEAEETIKLLRYGPGERCLGINDPDLWEAQAQLMQDLTLLTAPPDLDAAMQGAAVRDFYAAQSVNCR
jgi:ABC-type nitrate/sulfonate/bicarbonate transport system substrate-binding protein